MRAMVEGAVIKTAKGKSKEGKDFVFTKLLIDDDVYSVWNLDCSNCKQMERVKCAVYIFPDIEHNTLRLVKVGEGG